MLISFDFETFKIAPGRLAPPPVAVGFYDGTTSIIMPCHHTDPVGMDHLAQLLADPAITLCAHNASFDLGVACQFDPDRFFPLVYAAIDSGRIYCTKVAEMLKKIRLGRFHFDATTGKRNPSFSLAALASEYLGRDRSDEKKAPDAWRLRYRELYGVPVDQWPDAARDYLIDDVRHCFSIAEIQRREPENLLRETIEHDFALYLMSARGVRTDAAGVSKLERKLTDIVERAEAGLRASGILRKNGSQDMTRTRELVEASFDDPPRTAKGTVKTDTATLRDSNHPALLALADVRADRDELARYIPILKQGTTYPINAHFRVLVESGRTSCRSPNLQNQPRRSGVRETYIARPGYVWIAADYSIAELRSLAQTNIDRFGFSAMGDELRAGRDLHLVIAAELMTADEGATVSYEDAKTRYSAGDKAAKLARQIAKAANFGIPGGLGISAFCKFAAGYGVELSEDDAADIKRRWLDRFPEMSEYFRDISARCGAGGGSFDYVDERTSFIRGGVGYTDGCNHAFQHRTAIGAKNALAAVSRECYLARGPLAGSFPVNFIHDEIIIEAPEAKATIAAERLAEIMVAEMARVVPDVPTSVDVAAMRRWYKDAEPVRDASGRLLPWEPSL